MAWSGTSTPCLVLGRRVVLRHALGRGIVPRHAKTLGRGTLCRHGMSLGHGIVIILDINKIIYFYKLSIYLYK